MEGDVFVRDLTMFVAIGSDVGGDVRAFLDHGVGVLVILFPAVNEAAWWTAIGVLGHFARVREDPVRLTRWVQLDRCPCGLASDSFTIFRLGFYGFRPLAFVGVAARGLWVYDLGCHLNEAFERLGAYSLDNFFTGDS